MFVRNAWYVAAWDHEIGPELVGQRPDPFQKRVALIRKRQLRALFGNRFSDAPGNRFIVGKAHNKATLARHKSCGHNVFPRPVYRGSGLCHQDNCIKSARTRQ